MKNKIKLILLLLGTALFTILFWKRSLGINAGLFSVFLVAVALFSFPETFKNKKGLIILSGTLISGLAVAYHASGFAVFVWIVSIFFVQPFVHYKEFRTFFFAGFSAFIDFITSFVLIKENLNPAKKTHKKAKKIFKIIRLIIIPIIVFWIFYQIYKLAVPEFDKLTDGFFGKITIWLNNIFASISFSSIFFTLWGLFILSWIIYKRQNNFLLSEELKFGENVNRKSKELFKFSNPRGLKPLLKFENLIGVILLVSVNILLLFVNILDITTIWIGFEYTGDQNLKQFVHEGTYLLILSILLSMGILLYMFRNKLNFYRKNKYLKIFSYVWIIQNLVLLSSVIIRNLHYIKHFALAYLRIGLFFFLALVIVGLVTLVIKIHKHKNLFYLIKINSWALYVGFVLFALPDWDIIIAKYNLNHYPEAFVEASFLLTLDAKTYPIIDQHREILNQDPALNTYRYFSLNYNEEFDQKVDTFVEQYKKKTFIELNYADLKSFLYFKEKF
ncbi:MAG: DUF4173 domain-containing protein [Bacteroidales bacterium]|nr:DUF4173 domain-containing protein [Bacteroidales bacterium]